MIYRPKALYYGNGQTEKEKNLESCMRSMGIDFIPITRLHFLQTVGYLAKVKGFPPRKPSVPENVPSIQEDVLVLCGFTDDNLNLLLCSMKSGEVPSVALKAVLTNQNCFWTFAHLYEELVEEHKQFKEND